MSRHQLTCIFLAVFPFEINGKAVAVIKWIFALINTCASILAWVRVAHLWIKIKLQKLKHLYTQCRHVFPIQLTPISLATGFIKFEATYSRWKLTCHFLSILGQKSSKCKYLFLWFEVNCTISTPILSGKAREIIAFKKSVFLIMMFPFYSTQTRLLQSQNNIFKRK